MKNIFLVFFFSLLLNTAFGQEMERQVIANSTHFMESGDLSINATLGEIAIATLGDPTGLSLGQGFHQGSLMITSTYEPFVDFDFQVFPNPTVATIFISADVDEDLTAQILDVTGRVLLSKELAFPVDRTPLNLQSLPAAHYFLKITDKTGTPIYISSIQKINQ